jgi:hypothetical protein
MLIYSAHFYLKRIVSRMALLNNLGFPLVQRWGPLAGGVDADHE